MSEDEARETYLMIAGALATAGFGWVVDQVEDALADAVATDVPASADSEWYVALTALLNAVNIAFTAPGQLAAALSEGPRSVALDIPSEVQLLDPQYDPGTGDPTRQISMMWPFGDPEIPGLVERLLAESRR